MEPFPWRAVGYGAMFITLLAVVLWVFFGA
jgi:hypothetical protein